MDGTFDLKSAQLQMEGAISPVYLVNSIGSALTRKGEGLFAFTFALNGPAAAPVVSVNPLSGFVPGSLRDLFRSTERPKVPTGAPQPVEAPNRPRPSRSGER